MTSDSAIAAEGLVGEAVLAADGLAGEAALGMGDACASGCDAPLSDSEAAELLMRSGSGIRPDLSRRGYHAIKRTFDIVFSLFAMVVFSWLYIIVALAIKLDDPRGSVLFRQERIGRDGAPFTIYKFRSMRADAEDAIISHLSPEQLEQWEHERKVENDPRITRVGRIIRRTSIDELPQFANILKGDMSLVGPRPITHEELELHFTPDERRMLLSVRPGATGPWQAGEHHDATFESGRRQEIELSYVEEASIALDVRICIATVGTVLRGDSQ